MRPRPRWMAMVVFGLLIMLLPACGAETPLPIPAATAPHTPEPTGAQSTTAAEQDSAPAPESLNGAASKELVLSFTYQRADGNRLATGAGAVPFAQVLDLPLEGKPVWVAAFPAEVGSLWVAVLEDGRAQAFHVFALNRAEPVNVTPNAMPPGMPPMGYSVADFPALGVPPSETASVLSHVVILTDTIRLAYLEANGGLVVSDGYHEWREEINALPDARLLVDEQDRILVLADATGRYPHGALGDELEAGSIKLIRTNPVPQVIRSITIDPPAVVEGLAPIWADLDGDGNREIVVTVSDSEQGDRLVVYSESGEQIAVSSSIGLGNRWRHLIAAGPFGPGGEMELVDVLTPHLEPVVAFFKIDGDELKVAARLEGYTSHVLGSRNLDQAAGGDFDGDGLLEVLLMTPELTELAAVQHTIAGAREIWTVPAGGKITTNLGTAGLRTGQMVVGVGTDMQMLRLWLP